jgi:phospholipid transport system substrate-binding protein
MKQFFVALALFTLSCGAFAVAQPQPTNNPAQVLQQGIETITGYLAENRQANPAALKHYLNSQIVPYFDFKLMAQWVAGASGRNLNENQQRYLENLLKNDILGIMVSRLANYKDSQIRYYPVQVAPNQQQILLRADIIRPGQMPLNLAFRLHKGEEGWRVFDVIANGASAIAHYRSQFQEKMRPGRRAFR